MKPIMSLVLVALVIGVVGSSYGGDLSMSQKHNAGIPLAPAHVIRLGDVADQANVVLLNGDAAVVIALIAVSGKHLPPKGAMSIETDPADVLFDGLGSVTP